MPVALERQKFLKVALAFKKGAQRTSCRIGRVGWSDVQARAWRYQGLRCYGTSAFWNARKSRVKTASGQRNRIFNESRTTRRYRVSGRKDSHG